MWISSHLFLLTICDRFSNQQWDLLICMALMLMCVILLRVLTIVVVGLAQKLSHPISHCKSLQLSS